MKIKRTTTTRRPTRKNKRIMSGGGKMSKITRRFKDHFKRFFKINENDKIKKCEAWGSLNGIFKFVEARNKTYKDDEGNEVSGLDKMIGNINNTPNSSNKKEYIKAIDCFKQGCDTILSGSECVSYSDFVNGGGVAAPAPVETPPAVAAVAPVVSPADEETNDSPVAEVDADKGNNAGQSEAVVPAAVEDPAVEDPVATEATEATVAADATTDSNNEPQQEEDTLQSTQPAATTAAVVPEEDANDDKIKTIEGGGRSRRHSRPSRRIKSRKSKKGRMTRRKHRAVRR